MASSLQELGVITPSGPEPEELLLEVPPGGQVRFRLPESSFGGYHWYVAELTGATVLLAMQSLSGQRQQLVNVIASKQEGSSRFRLREARPFSPEDVAHELIVYVTVKASPLSEDRGTAEL